MTPYACVAHHHHREAVRLSLPFLSQWNCRQKGLACPSILPCAPRMKTTHHRYRLATAAGSSQFPTFEPETSPSSLRSRPVADALSSRAFSVSMRELDTMLATHAFNAPVLSESSHVNASISPCVCFPPTWLPHGTAAWDDSACFPSRNPSQQPSTERRRPSPLEPVACHQCPLAPFRRRPYPHIGRQQRQSVVEPRRPPPPARRHHSLSCPTSLHFDWSRDLPPYHTRVGCQCPAGCKYFALLPTSAWIWREQDVCVGNLACVSFQGIAFVFS